jgi:hypothetical protein
MAVVAVLSLIAVLVPPPVIHATTFLVKDFEGLVAEAEQIFVGTVTGRGSQKLAGGTIVTDVTFAASHILKGPREPSIVLRVVGGTVGGEALELSGVPQLDLGVRYIVFVKGNGRAMFPVVGGSQGLFRVVHDAGLDVDVVLSAQGAPLADVPVPLTAFLEAAEAELGLR